MNRAEYTLAALEHAPRKSAEQTYVGVTAAPSFPTHDSYVVPNGGVDKAMWQTWKDDAGFSWSRHSITGRTVAFKSNPWTKVGA